MEIKFNTNKKNKHGYDRFWCYYKYANGVILDTTKTILISVPQNISGEYCVPTGVTTILDNAFEGCDQISKINLPDTIQALGNQCFKDCLKLNTIIIPKSVEYIAPQCFLYSSIVSITFEGAQFITHKNGIYSRNRELIALFGSFRKYVLPTSLNSIQEGVFANIHSLEEVDLSACRDMDMLKNGMFAHCKALSKVKLPTNISVIPKDFFLGCYSLDLNLTEFNCLTQIGDGAFSYTSSLLIKLPERLVSIGDSAFRGCKFFDIIIPASVKTIERWSFAHCCNLETIRIEGNNTRIGTCVFDQTLRLKNVVINDNLQLERNVPNRWGFELSKSLSIILSSTFKD